MSRVARGNASKCSWGRAANTVTHRLRPQTGERVCSDRHDGAALVVEQRRDLGVRDHGRRGRQPLQHLVRARAGARARARARARVWVWVWVRARVRVRVRVRQPLQRLPRDESRQCTRCAVHMQCTCTCTCTCNMQCTCSAHQCSVYTACSARTLSATKSVHHAQFLLTSTSRSTSRAAAAAAAHNSSRRASWPRAIMRPPSCPSPRIG